MTKDEKGLNDGRRTNRRSSIVVKVLVVLVVLAAAGFLFRELNVRYGLGTWIQDQLKAALGWIDGLGAVGVLVYIGIYILCCVFFIPGSIVTLGAGVVYGVVWGTVYVSIASTLGATLAFLIGRYFLRGWVSAKIAGNENFEAIDEAVGREGWKIVGLTRLSPVFPFNLLNYSFGLTKVSLRGYFFASWIGMFPGTVVYVWIGTLAGSLARIGDETEEGSGAKWTVKIVGLIVAVAVTAYVTRIARKALAERVQSAPTESPETRDRPST